MLDDAEDLKHRVSRLERRESRQRHIDSGKKRELTIAAGVVTVRHSDCHVSIDTQSDAGTDDLDTISGGHEGQILVVHGEDNARIVTLKDGGGNLRLVGDYAFGNINDSIVLQRRSDSIWMEISRSDVSA